jgi:hypothetical protein
MKKNFVPMIMCALLLASCANDFTEDTESVLQYSEWDYSRMPKRSCDFVPSQSDYDALAPIADLLMEDWEQFHNWEMPEVFIENYSATPDFWDLWNIISWSMVQDAFCDTIGECDFWIEFWEAYGNVYWK